MKSVVGKGFPQGFIEKTDTCVNDNDRTHETKFTKKAFDKWILCALSRKGDGNKYRSLKQSLNSQCSFPMVNC